MSVLKSRRNDSKAEYVNLAYNIYIDVLQFLTRLSARYGRLVSSDTIQLAGEVLDNCEKTNSIYPSDELRVQLREQHLVEARAALMALDVRMAIAHDLMRKNPQGCFENLTAPDAMKRLDKMSQKLGEKIDKENGYLTNLLKSDKKRIK